MVPEPKTVTIAESASLSDAVDLAGYKAFGIIMPESWDAANLTFQASSSLTGTFYDVYEGADGTEVTVQAAASRAIVDLPELGPLRYLKIRSGATGTPVVQTAERSLTIVLKM